MTYNPFSGQDEIIIRDTNGRMKVLKGMKIEEREEEREKKAIPQAPVTLPQPADKAKGVARSFDYTAVSEYVFQQLPWKEEVELLKNRLRNIILSRLKEIRSDVETLEILKRDTQTGGTALDEKKSSEVLKIVKETARKIGDGGWEMEKETGRVREEEKSVGEAQDVEIKQAVVERSAPFLIKEIEKEKLLYRGSQIPPSITAPSAALSSQQRGGEGRDRSAPKAGGTLGPKPAPEMKGSGGVLTPKPSPELVGSRGGEPQVVSEQKTAQKPFVALSSEGSYKPKLIGPVEELRQMTLVDFRRLSNDPEKATGKIMEKIKLLGKESLELKIEGIFAWRQSEVFRSYQDMGRESLDNKHSLKQVIEKRKLEGKPVLSEEEFTAIMDLNQRLRF